MINRYSSVNEVKLKDGLYQQFRDKQLVHVLEFSIGLSLWSRHAKPMPNDKKIFSHAWIRWVFAVAGILKFY